MQPRWPREEAREREEEIRETRYNDDWRDREGLRRRREEAIQRSESQKKSPK
jgi:hypothetical protein